MMDTDTRRVRAHFIRLLRQQTPDHPWVRQHDRRVQLAAEARVLLDSLRDEVTRALVTNRPLERLCRVRDAALRRYMRRMR